MKFYIVSDAYIAHLKSIDSKVPDNYAGQRPYIGILLEVNGHQYLAPLTSHKPKHDAMQTSTPTIFKLHEKGVETNKLGMIQLNNMIPVTSADVVLLDIAAQPLKYQRMLSLQLAFIKSNQDKIKEKASKLYELVTAKKHKFFCSISCDFTALEAACARFVR